MKADAGRDLGPRGWVENGRYRPLGDACGEQITRLARDADDMVVVSSPSVDPDLVEAASRAGRCYIVTSGREESREDGGREAGSVRPGGIAACGFLENALVRFADGFGASVVLADPRSSRARGLFLSSNLGPEAIRCGRRLDVYLEPPEVSEIWQTVRWAFWELASRELRAGKLEGCRPLGEINPPKPARILRSDASDRGIEAGVAEILGDGASRVVVAAPALDAGHWISGRLRELAGAGVGVTILTSTGCPAGAVSALRGAGARVLGFSCLHANAIASGKGALLAPSIATSRRPELEFGLLLRDGRAAEVERIMRGWEENYQYEFK